jgi:hypothetical protein
VEARRLYQQYSLKDFTVLKTLEIEKEAVVENLLSLGDMLFFQFKPRKGKPDWKAIGVATAQTLYEGVNEYGPIQTIVNLDRFQKDGHLLFVTGNRKDPASLVKFNLADGRQTRLTGLGGKMLNRTVFHDGATAMVKSTKLGVFFAKVEYSCIDVVAGKERFSGIDPTSWNNTINLGKAFSPDPRVEIRSFPVRYDGERPLFFQAANPINVRSQKAAPGSLYPAEPLRWFDPVKRASKTKTIAGAEHLHFESIAAGLLYFGAVRKVDGATNMSISHHVAGLLDRGTGQFIWERKIDMARAMEVVDGAKGTLQTRILGSDPGKASSYQAFTIGEGLPVPPEVPQNTRATAVGIAIPPPGGPAFNVLEYLKNYLQETVALSRQGRQYGAKTPLPGSDDYFLLSCDTLSLWKSNDSLVWEIPGTVETTLPHPTRGPKVQFGNTYSPEIQVHHRVGDLAYLTISGAKEKVFYVVDLAGGQILRKRTGSPIVDVEENLLFAFYTSKGEPGKPGNLVITDRASGSVKTHVLFGKGPIEGHILKVFKLDPDKPVDLGAPMPPTRKTGRPGAGMEPTVNLKRGVVQIHAGGGSFASVGAGVYLGRQYSLFLGAALGTGLSTYLGAFDNLQGYFNIAWVPYGSRVFTPVFGLKVVPAFEAPSVFHLALGGQAGFKIRIGKVHLLADVTFYATVFSSAPRSPIYAEASSAPLAIRPGLGIQF